MKAALIAVSVLAGLLGLALVTLVLGGSSATIGDQPELENKGDAPPAQENGPTRRVATEIKGGGRWKDVDLEISLLEARRADPPRGDTIGIEEREHRWIAAEFEVRNRAAVAIDASPSLVAIDSEGQAHEAGGIDAIGEPSLRQLSVPAGASRKGELSVQVPDDARIERLEVRLIGEPVGWDLERSL